MPTAKEPPQKPTSHNLPPWLLDAWPLLTPLERTHIAAQVFTRARKYRPYPNSLVFMAGLATLALLALLPTHPMTYPTALGGGLGLAIIVRTVRLVFF